MATQEPSTKFTDNSRHLTFIQATENFPNSAVQTTYHISIHKRTGMYSKITNPLAISFLTWYKTNQLVPK